MRKNNTNPITDHRSPITILGIETSCDETAAAVVQGEGETVRVLSNVVHSQIDIFKKYGGVIPEVAAREHVIKILSVIDEALKKAGIARSVIDAIAVTIGPGLITSLIVGIETAKSLSYAWDIPLVAVNHIEGHIYANFIDHATRITQHVSNKHKTPDHWITGSPILFPSIILTVSGGHTQLVLMKGHGKFKTIGSALDDAAGEAFDKAAQLMGIGYPGGPAISRYAAQSMRYKAGNINHGSPDHPITRSPINLPRPMIDKGFDFSFSGLKTALRYALEKDADWKNKVPEYSAEFQQAVIDVLIAKTLKAAKAFKAKTIMLAGGVSANSELRSQMEQAIRKNLPITKYHIPNTEFTTDNAAMIASAGYFKAKAGKFTPWKKLKVDCNAEL